MTPSSGPNRPDAGWTFDNSYAQLPEVFYVRLNPVPVREPKLVVFNKPLAQSLGLIPEVLQGEEGAVVFAGNRIPEGAEPLAQAYAGHQFGYFTMLGDGRAILMGEQITPTGERVDIQFKGSGKTPFSRNGDGRAALGPMLREYIISEALNALGIPTTRSLAVVTTGEPVFRETPLQGAILTRTAASHIRVGTFQYAAAQDNPDALRTLADYTLHRHFPDLAAAENPYLALLQAVMERQASLVSRWLLVGFIHGVMNTDNMALCGETIDYGPCAFMDAYDPNTVFSSIDQNGRYAYGRQPQIAQWNLARFAETLLPLIHEDQQKAVSLATDAVSGFPDTFRQFWLAGMRAKLGLSNQEADDSALVEDLLDGMQRHGADFTNTFRDLASGSLPEASVFQASDFKAWFERWQARLKRQSNSREAYRRIMNTHNPAVIPRNHRVEEALAAATEQADFSVMENLLEVLSHPYQDPPEEAGYHLPPPPSVEPYRTFCGT
ncbi:MAG: YdiU family protein [Deltaproteobacteria bacterium]|nr:YdiU family protein [Deltaproteobacteria bacterium]